jgi:hypothetical protein
MIKDLQEIEAVVCVNKNNVRRVLERIKRHRHKATDIRSTRDVAKDLFNILTGLAVQAPFVKAVFVLVMLTSCDGKSRPMRICPSY